MHKRSMLWAGPGVLLIAGPAAVRLATAPVPDPHSASRSAALRQQAPVTEEIAVPGAVEPGPSGHAKPRRRGGRRS